MFREMRRKRQELSEEACRQVLLEATSGVLAVYGDEGYPYAVPLSFVYAGSKIYFHGAKSGHKLDAIRRNEKVSFCVIGQDEIIPEKFTTYFRSVIVFGTARILEDETEMRTAIEILSDKYAPGRPEERDAEIGKEWPALCLVELSIDHMSGKEAIELVRRKTSL